MVGLYTDSIGGLYLTARFSFRSPDGTPLSDNQKKKRAKQAEKERLKAEKAAKQQQEQAKREAADVVSS